MAVWNLNNIHKLEKTPKLVSELKDKVLAFNKYREELNETISKSKFMEIVKAKEDILGLISILSSRAALWLCENTSDSKRNAHEARISNICTEASNETMFFNIWFKELSKVKAKEYLENSGKYRYYLERIRAYKPYILSEKEERIINLKDTTGADTVTKIYSMITSRFRFDFEGKQLSIDELNQYKQSPDREKRVKAYTLLFSKFAEEEVISEIYRSVINDWKNENIKLRGFTEPISVMNHSNDIPDKSVSNLLSSVKKNAHIFREYFSLKAKLCNLKNDRYDIYAPYSLVEKSYSYDESKKITLETYNMFDEKAFNMAKKIFDENRVHSEITENKRSGAFCSSVLNNVTPYIMLNHVNKLNDLFTMMHEFGHGIHDLSAGNQCNFTFISSLPMAETSSIFGEMLLARRMLKEGSREEKIETLTRLLDGQYASIIRQAYFTLFEIEAHKLMAEGAETEKINNAYYENLKEHLEGIDIPESFRHEWKFVPHFFHSPFYCYAYAFGNLLVLSLFKMYEKEGKDFIPKYMKILSYGGSESPAKILSEAGIDINTEEFWQHGFDIIKEEIEELKKLTG